MAKKATKKAKKSAAKKAAPKKKAVAKKSAGKKRAKAPKGDPLAHLNGTVTHTDFASSDPAATKTWMQKALGWKFKQTMETPAGPYFLFTYSPEGGGGIGSVPPGDQPGSCPYLKVSNAEKSYRKAISLGATGIQEPMEVMPGMRICMVRAPGGVMVGFAGA